MRFKDLELGDYFIAAPLEADLMPGRAVVMHAFRKVSSDALIPLGGRLTQHTNQGTARRCFDGSESFMPQEMPVLKVLV